MIIFRKRPPGLFLFLLLLPLLKSQSLKHTVVSKIIVEGNKTIYVRNGIGELRKATVRKAVKSDDLALLDLERPFSSEYSLDIPNNYKLRIGQKAYVMGFPLADFLGENMPSITEGIISKDVGYGERILINPSFLDGKENLRVLNYLSLGMNRIDYSHPVTSLKTLDLRTHIKFTLLLLMGLPIAFLKSLKMKVLTKIGKF